MQGLDLIRTEVEKHLADPTAVETLLSGLEAPIKAFIVREVDNATIPLVKAVSSLEERVAMIETKIAAPAEATDDAPAGKSKKGS